MATFIKLTTTGGSPVFVNFDLVTSIRVDSVDGKPVTCIRCGDEMIDVKETMRDLDMTLPVGRPTKA